MTFSLLWLVLPTLVQGLPPAQAPAPGSIVGVVRFTGKVPEARELQTNDGVLLHHDLLVDGKTKGLCYVVAVLEDAPAQPKLKKADPVVVDQRDWLFVPRVVAVQRGQAVRFDNSDGANHGVLASSTVAANQLNVVTPPGQPYEHVFEPQQDPVLIGCPLHGWMRAWVYVVTHPWFAVSDPQGAFRIREVPPGKYTLLLHHADSGLQERRPVEVRTGAATEMVIEWQKLKERSKK